LDTQIIQQVKYRVQSLPCLGITHHEAFMLVKADAVDIGYGGILAIVLCILKFQDDLFIKKFLLRIVCKSAKEILQKDIQI